MPIKVADKNIQNVFSILAKYIIKLKKNNVNTTYLEKIINALVYEIYLPELVKKANASLFTHIIKMKDIVIDSSDDSKTIIADKLLKELNDSVHPINIAIQKVLEIEEVMVIEKGI